MAKLLEFLDRHTARNLFRSSHLNKDSFETENDQHHIFLKNCF